jgi:RimJ/RimL family protein N-acetyltransferase
MENKLKPTLQNEKVILRPLELSDEEALLPIAQEQELWIYGHKDLAQPGELKKYIEKAIRDRAAENTAVWLVIDAKTGQVAGCTRIAEISWEDERGQIGWTWIGKKFQGSGLNKAMKYEILKYGFETLGFNRMELKADERNTQSRRAMEKIGAKYEGTLRQHMKIRDGYIRNTVFYSILKSEWEEVKRALN